MKKSIVLIFAFFLVACVPGIAPQPFPAWTPFPTGTPMIVTATPIVQSATVEFTLPFTPTLATATETLTSTATLQLTNTPFQAVQVDILGCNTSIDILHGMGEVTNAYVTVKNTGTIDLPNTCSLLRGIDESEREHPDKKVCVLNLPIQNQVTFKLTIDSAYKQDTIIQVDTLSNETLILRVDKQSCRDIGLFGGEPEDVGVVKPIQ